MGWSKRDLIAQAFEEIGLATSVFDLSAEQLQSGLRKLDSMMAAWNARGIRLGYPVPSTPSGSDLEQDSGLKDAANEAVYTNLALRLAGPVGRQVPGQLATTAKQGYNALLALAAAPRELQMPSGTPAGAGNRHRDSVFLDDPTDGLDAGPDSKLEFE